MPRAFLSWTAGLAGASWAGVTLAELDRFDARIALAAGVLAAVVVASLLRTARGDGQRADGRLALLALVLTGTLLPAVDTTLLSQDASLHRAAGRWLATHGTLAIADPSVEAVAPDDRYALFGAGSVTHWRMSFVRLPGGIVTPDLDETTAYPSFSHLLSVWVAIAWTLGGETGAALLGVVFAFSAWWAIGLIAWRDGAFGGAVAAVALLASWLPEHWFARFLMPEILAQALVWGGVAASRFAMEAGGFDFAGRPQADCVRDRRSALAAGGVAGACLGVATFARLEQFWVFVPALLVVRVAIAPSRRLLPPGAFLPFAVIAVQGLLHLLWIPTDYGNRIYRNIHDAWRALVFTLAALVDNDGYVLGFLLNRVAPILLLAGLVFLLVWGQRMERRQPGSRLRPLLGVLAAGWLLLLYREGLPEGVAVLQGLWWYVPWAAWAAIAVALPGSFVVPPLEGALLLEAFDQVVSGRVTQEHVWAARRLVTVVLPALALAAARAGFAGRPSLRRAAARALVGVAIVLGVLGIRPLVGVPYQTGAHRFASELAAEIPPEATVVLVQPLDWTHLAAALWLGEGRRTIVMRVPTARDHDETLAGYLRTLPGPIFVLAGAAFGPEGGDHRVPAELARLPDDFRLEPVLTRSWEGPTLEVTRDRPPESTVALRATVHLYRLERSR